MMIGVLLPGREISDQNWTDVSRHFLPSLDITMERGGDDVEKAGDQLLRNAESAHEVGHTSFSRR